MNELELVVRQLAELLTRHEVYGLVSTLRAGKRNKVHFDVHDIEGYVEVRNSTVREHKPTITLSPTIIADGFTSKEALSVIVIHELGHIDHIELAWGNGELTGLLDDPEKRENYADMFVIASGWENELIHTLRAMERVRIEKGRPEGSMTLRLAYLESRA